MQFAATCVSPLGAASNYNMFLFGNLTGLRDSLGNVAVGGNVDLTSSGDSSIHGHLVVSGNLSAGNGQVNGSLTIGGNNNAGGNFNILGGVTKGTPINFAAAKTSFVSQSTALAANAASGSTTLSGSSLTFSGGNAGQNVFTVSANQLAAASSVQINAPAGATVVINVVGGAAVTFSNKGVSLSGVTHNQVLWNMPNVPSLNMSGVSFQGSILAPNTNVVMNNGNFEGTLIAQSYAGNGEGHNFPFSGCLTTALTAIPKPPPPSAPTATRP